MPLVGWLFGVVFFSVHAICLFSVGVTTFDKGRRVLGAIGFVLPILWFFGALLPARKGSHYEFDQMIRRSMQTQPTSL